MIPDCGDKGKKKKWNKLSGNRHEKWQEKRQSSCRFFLPIYTINYSSSIS